MPTCPWPVHQQKIIYVTFIPTTQNVEALEFLGVSTIDLGSTMWLYTSYFVGMKNLPTLPVCIPTQERWERGIEYYNYLHP